MSPENLQSIKDKIITQTNSIQQRSTEKIRDQLILWINELINNDFNSLLQILYSIDVDEINLKKKLRLNENSDAASIIADLIIKRQLQKIYSRKHYVDNKNSASEESW